MENIHIEQTKYTPKVVLDFEKGVIEIIGDSLPENTVEFYSPLIDGLHNYFKEPKDQTVVNLELTYFNSSSSKLFFDFFDILEEGAEDCDVVINWYHDEENETMEEAGEDFKEDFEHLNFNVIAR